MSGKNAGGSPGFGSLAGMLDSMEFLRKAWSSFSLPTNLAPTVDPEEIDRRIADLRTVEQWLEVNLGMLRSAIQGMEIQRGTLAALRAFGQAMSRPSEGGDLGARAMEAIGEMQRAAAAGAQAAGATAARVAADAATQSGSGAAGSGAAGAPTGERPQAQQAPAGTATRAKKAGSASPGAAGPSPSTLADEISRAATAAVSPAAWWKLLQSQFDQVAQAALAGTGLVAGVDSQQPAPGAKPAGKRAPARDAAAARSAAPRRRAKP